MVRLFLKIAVTATLVSAAVLFDFMNFGPTERWALQNSDSYRSWVKLDRCLDWGGVFDEQTKQCTPSFEWFCKIRRSVWNERTLRCDDVSEEIGNNAL